MALQFYLHKRNEKNVHRDFYENVHTSLNNSFKLEIIQLYAYRRIDKHIMIFLYNGILLRNDVEQTADMGNNLDKSQKQLSWGKLAIPKRIHIV